VAIAGELNRPHILTISSPARAELARHLLPYVVLFLTLITAYAYTPPRWQDWNQNSRFDLTRALVEQHTVNIDAYVANTGDYAELDGHFYTDKAPGLSLIAAPVYAATRAVRPLGLSWLAYKLGQNGSFTETLNPDGRGTSRERVDSALALYIATVLCVGIPAAVMAVVIAHMVTQLSGCRTAGMLTALIIGLATPVFSYSQAFYGHVLAAACIAGALAAIVSRENAGLSDHRLVLVGALLGTAVVVEYPAAVAGLPIALLALALERRRALIFGVLGALVPLGVLVAYDLIAFGTPLPVGYEHSTLWQDQHDVGFMSLTYPRWVAIWGLSGSSYRGLFFYSPILIAAIPGAWLALKDPRQRLPSFVALSSFGLMFLFASSSVMWWGGFSVGPRYILPAIPLLALPLGACIGWLNAQPFRLRAAGLSLIALLGALSTVLIWTTTFARQNYPSDTIQNPLLDYVWPAIRSGDIARNLGMVTELAGLASLIPLLIVVSLGVFRIAFELLRAREVAG
jgi:hypothetical protein